MLHLVVARQNEPLDWIGRLPSDTQVTVYNGGAPLDPAAFDATLNVRPALPQVPPVGLFLHHLQQRTGQEQRGAITVFTPGDPLRYAPAFFDLLARAADFGPLQVLSSCEDRCAGTPALPVQGEHFSVATLAPLAHQRETALRVGKAYRRKHGLAENTALLPHFFEQAGLASLAAEAAQADIGIRAYGAMVAVRPERLAQVMSQLADALPTLAVLLRADRNYPEVIEQAWLHLLGLPFQSLDALALPRPSTAPAPTSVPSLARVVASIDAVLAQAAPRLGTAGAAVAANEPSRTAPTAPVLEDVVVLRQRAEAAFLRGDTSAAWELLLRALDQAPRDIGLLASATQMAYAQQDTERALHCARRALAVDPDHLECLFTLGMCLAASGQAEEALAIFERLNQGDLAMQWQERQRDSVGPTPLRDRSPVAA